MKTTLQNFSTRIIMEQKTNVDKLTEQTKESNNSPPQNKA